ncbi:MAG: glycine--tRNA ligase subunit beta [Thermodesulfobacteriota bacterium]
MERDLLLEIGTEEIPARFIPGALGALQDLAEQRLGQARLTFQNSKSLGTPRRLALLVSGVSAYQEEKEEIFMGPPKSAAFDEKGLPTKVAVGFAKAKGAAVEDLSFVETSKGTYIALKQTLKGLPAETVLMELLPQLIMDLPFPKFMRWGTSSFRFVRPVHWILALLGDRTLPFSLEAITAGNRTFGHRFMAPDPILLKETGEYLLKLRQAKVMVDPEERMVMLRQGIAKQAEQAGGKVPDDPDLLKEVNFLIEFPEPVSGQINPDFLQLPPEVLVTSMKAHQRYFPLTDKEGRLLPHFITVNNTRVEDTLRVVKGHEKVLRARLSDARFFFQEDLKKPLWEKVDHLKTVIFHSRLGTSYAKVERIIRLADYLSQKLAPEKAEPIRRCALLCKADLTSHMVGEFPDLQGIMGREYALRSGEARETAQGILDHYLPTSVGGTMPETVCGALVGLADRLDTLVGFFGVGQIPTGSADPYALRRQAQGCILILWEKGYSLSVNDILDQALSSYKGLFKRSSEEIKKDLKDFLSLRLAYLLEGEGISRETIEAVLAVGWDDLSEVRQRCRSLQDFQKHPDFSSLAGGCKRALNILKGLSSSETGLVDPALLIEDQEKTLFRKVQDIEKEMAHFFSRKAYSEYLIRLAGLRPVIDDFFDKVLVMAPEENIRRNRLALLYKLTSFFNQFALFSVFSF